MVRARAANARPDRIGRLQRSIHGHKYPAGATVRRVFGRAPDVGLQLLHEFAGFTTDGEVLEFTPPDLWSGLKAIRVETLESPSWVAWREIEILSP